MNASTPPAIDIVDMTIGDLQRGAPFSQILVGRMWSEAKLLGFACAYQQAFPKRIRPNLTRSPAPAT